MKKIFIFIIISIFLITNVYADDPIVNVNFTLNKEIYTEVVKTFDGTTTVFDVTFNENLNNEQLKTILSQKSGIGSSPLAIYQTLKIDVTPNAGTNFSSLVGKSKYYRGNGGGAWVDDYKTSQLDKSETAEKKDMTSYFWPWGMGVQFRTTPEGTFSNTIPSEVNLDDKTMEQKLATLLNVDLEATPEGVVNKYGELWRFRPLPTGYIYQNKFEFYDEKSTPPILKTDSTTEYLTDSLNHLDSRYVVIRYHNLTAPTMSEQNKEQIINNESKTGMIIAILGLSSISAILYVYKKKKIKI